MRINILINATSNVSEEYFDKKIFQVLISVD